MVDDKRLARHLVQTNTCSRELLLEGRRLQREADDDGTLYDALLAHGLVDEATLVDAAATLLNLPSVQLEHFTFDEDLVGLITREMAFENQVLPLKRKDGGLMLAMTDPLDIMAMDDIATHIGSDIQPVLVGRVDLAAAIERTYPILEEDSAIDLVGGEGASQGGGELDQDSWASFFDDAASVEVDRESSSISQDMRDRPTSLEMSLDELGIEDSPGVASDTSDILESFDAPPPRGAGVAHDEDLLDLGEWEVEDGQPPEDEDPVFVLEDIAEDSVIDLDDEVESGPVFVLEEIAESDDEPGDLAQEPATEGDIFGDVFAEVADDGDADDDDFEVLDPPEPEPEPKPKLSALSSLRARLASVKLNALPKPNTLPRPGANTTEEPDADEEPGEPAPPDTDTDTNASASGQALGRVAVKRIAVKRQTGEVAIPGVVEKNSAQERQRAAVNATQEVDPDDILGASIDDEELEFTLSHEDLFDSTHEEDAPLELDDFEIGAASDVTPTTEFDPNHLIASNMDPPTREVQLDDIFGSLGEGVGAESTNASEDVQFEIEELSRSIRQSEQSLGNRFSGEHSPEMDMSRETTANEALTRDRIAQMSRDRKLSQAGITSSGATLLNLPENVSEGQLLRALVTVLLDRKLIDRAELIELAEALPAE